MLTGIQLLGGPNVLIIEFDEITWTTEVMGMVFPCEDITMYDFAGNIELGDVMVMGTRY